MAVGDVVYLAEAENDDPTYRLGVVEEVKPGKDGCVRTVSIRYTNPEKEPGKRSPPKVTTRPIHKIAVIAPAGYMFEDDTGGGETSPRRPRCNLGVKKGPEAAGIPEGDPANEADSGEPKGDEPRPAGRKRRGRPKKSDKPGATGCKVGGEPQPAAKKRPGRPRKKPAAGSDENAVKEGGKKQAAQDPGEQQQTPRRGRSRDLAPKGPQNRERSC